MTAKTMNAFVLLNHGGFDSLRWHTNWPVPQPQPHEVQIKVHACGLNNTDVNTRTGWYSPSVTGATDAECRAINARSEDAAWSGSPICFPRIQGADVCGEVVTLGEGVDSSLHGRRVLVDPWLRDWNEPDNFSKTGYLGSERDGGFAEYLCVPAANVHPIQSHLSSSELATFATSFITALNMLQLAEVGHSDTVLVTGSSGGVGSALIQLSKHLGAKVFALTSKNHHQDVIGIGADHVLLRNDPMPLAMQIQKINPEASISVIADVVGGDQWPELLDSLNVRGRYVVSGAIAGPIVPLDLRTLYLRCLRFYGASVTPAHLFAELVGMIEKNILNPLLARSFPLNKLIKAQQLFSSKNFFGNVVVSMEH